MKKQALWAILLLLFVNGVSAQQKNQPSTNQWTDLATTLGNSQGTVAASYVYAWSPGKRKRWEIGIGLRYTMYIATNSDFTTAPGRLSRSNTTPFLIVFAGQKTENWDTLTVRQPFVNTVNVSVNFGYHLSGKWLAGFNIDLIGFSFGPVRNAVLTSNGIAIPEPRTKPASFNILLTGDNDYGSLNSEFFVKYQLSRHWGIRAIYCFYFAEYKTGTIQQTAPDGTLVTQFRNKVNSGGLGLSYHF